MGKKPQHSQNRLWKRLSMWSPFIDEPRFQALKLREGEMDKTRTLSFVSSLDNTNCEGESLQAEASIQAQDARSVLQGSVDLLTTSTMNPEFINMKEVRLNHMYAFY